MKKLFYILILLIELVVDYLMISLAWVNSSWITCVIAIAITAALLGLQIYKLINATDAACKRKRLLNIALTLLIPLAASILMFFWMLFGLMMVI